MAWKFFTSNGAEKKVAASVSNLMVGVNATPAVTTAVGLVVPFTVEDYKTDTNMHSTSTNTTRLVCTQAGNYLVWANANYFNNAVGDREIRISKNGAGVAFGGTELAIAAQLPGSTGVNSGVNTSAVAALAVGDYIEVTVYHNQGSTLNPTVKFGMTKLDSAVVSYVGVPGSLVGQEVAYAQITANATISSTTEAAGSAVVTAPSFTADGSTPYLVEFFSPFVVPAAALNGVIEVCLFEGATELCRLAIVNNPATTAMGVPVNARYRYTPTAGAHTLSVTAFQVNGNGVIQAGNGGTGAVAPSFIRITRAA